MLKPPLSRISSSYHYPFPSPRLYLTKRIVGEREEKKDLVSLSQRLSVSASTSMLNTCLYAVLNASCSAKRERIVKVVDMKDF
jgi:hypothetical protein